MSNPSLSTVSSGELTAARTELLAQREADIIMLDQMHQMGLGDSDSCAARVKAIDTILAALDTATLRAEELEQDAMRFRFLAENPLGLRGVDGNSSFTKEIGLSVMRDYTDMAIDYSNSLSRQEGVRE